MTALRPLAFALLALAMFYVAWFARDEHLLTGLVAFALPPFLLGVAAWRGWHRAAFVAGVLALDVVVEDDDARIDVVHIGPRPDDTAAVEAHLRGLLDLPLGADPVGLDR